MVGDPVFKHLDLLDDYATYWIQSIGLGTSLDLVNLSLSSYCTSEMSVVFWLQS